VNGIGPELATLAVPRLGGDAGSPPAFATAAALEQDVRTVCQPCGAQTDAQTDAHWRRLTETSLRRLPDGLGACRTGGASAANRPLRSISHRLFAPWQGYGAANTARTVLAGADSPTPKPDRLLVTPHHDPALVRQFSMHPADCTLWEARVALPVPVLVTIPGCGHDPVPYTPAQFAW